VVDGGDVPEAWLSRDDGGQVTLLGGWSPTGGRHHFPPAAVCPYSGADDVEVVPLPRRGTPWGVDRRDQRAARPPGPVPYGFGIVELDRVGLRVVGRLN
jgi:uncharacterized OB-fold protein